MQKDVYMLSDPGKILSKRTLALRLPGSLNVWTLYLLLVAIAWPHTVAARAEREQQTEELIVTGRHTSPYTALSNSAAIITAQDIARLPATHLGELLSREANVNLQSFFGTGKSTTIDIRGMGETAASNVLIMVDGIRLNASDLSGADLSTIPIDEIERIEIIRGGGSVRYGNGAVGGVINIMLKKPTPGMHAKLDLRYGSHGRAERNVTLSAGRGGFSVFGTLNAHELEAYRENGFLDKKHAALEVNFNRYRALNFGLRATLHDDEYGLPGPVSLVAFRGSDSERRASTAPFDRGESLLRRYNAYAELDLARLGQLALKAEFRGARIPSGWVTRHCLQPPNKNKKFLRSPATTTWSIPCRYSFILRNSNSAAV